MTRAPIRLWTTAGRIGGGADLPCPWCQAQTAEDDISCPGCGRRFG